MCVKELRVLLFKVRRFTVRNSVTLVYIFFHWFLGREEIKVKSYPIQNSDNTLIPKL